MKIYKEVTVPASLRRVVDKTQCDLCGKTSTDEWQKGDFDATETEVRMKTGSNYPEGGNGEETEIDICPECFQTKLIPWVQAQGGKPTVKEWDW